MMFGRVQVSKLGQWVPHLLTDANKIERVRIARQLLERYERRELRLDDIITSDEKWVLYTNVVRGRSWVDKVSAQRLEVPKALVIALMLQDGIPLATAKPGLHPKKVMLSQDFV